MQPQTGTYTYTNTSSNNNNNTPGINSINHDQTKSFEQLDKEKRSKNIIISGMHETNKINRGDRYTDDVKSIQQIFKYL